MIPKSSNFPNSFDSDTNLFLVHDSLRVRLVEDYNPGDRIIFIEGDEKIIEKFPPNGIITLTEQCSEIDKRALSFYYNSRTSSSFDELELLPEFEKLVISKPKKTTNVTMNVLDKHHNHLKDALISVQHFLGTKFDDEKNQTLTGRIKNLEKIIFTPKAWFSASVTVGLAPLKVEFINQSIRLGDGFVKETWDFGEKDSAPVVITSENIKSYTSKQGSVAGVEYSGTKLVKTYHNPGVYDVKLTMTNDKGENSVEFKQVITVRAECPELAVIRFTPRLSQNYNDSDPPKLRSLANNFISLGVPQGENPENPGYSFGGELLNSDLSPVDPIVEYSWYLNDDLPHVNSNEALASYSLGGYYDVSLRVDTKFGSYRITNYENSIDIIESKNLWLFNYKTSNNNSSGIIQCYEFGLNSETFKTLGNQTVQIDRNSEFLNKSPYSYGSENYYNGTLEKAKKEFERNVEFVPSGTTGSGDKGNTLLFWASGGLNVDEKKIHIRKYNAFEDTYENINSIINRPWNWVSLNSLNKVYFLFGHGASNLAGENSAFSQRIDYDLSSETTSQPIELQNSNFENGADELLDHPSYFDEEGLATNGYFAVYRSAWKDSTGYILRNSSVNEFFRLGNFYKTKGSISNQFSTITKLPDIVGSVKLEGQLVTLYNGIFMFNNSGEICAWNDTASTWEVGRANSSSLSFRSVQDTNVSNFEDKSNTLLAASDMDRVAYLSYDYSDKTFVKFNATDLTFSTTKFRPIGKQFKMGVY